MEGLNQLNNKHVSYNHVAENKEVSQKMKKIKKLIKLFQPLIKFHQKLLQVIKNNVKPFDVYEAYFNNSLELLSNHLHQFIPKPSEEGEENATVEQSPTSKLPLILSFLWSILSILMIACTK